MFAAGPDVFVRPQVALALHLVFHELTMNASKYGALTTTSGYVTVDWKVCASIGVNPKVALVWKEQGGPIVRPPVRSGFGSRLIERAIAGIDEVHIAFKETGVHCFMLIDPIAAKATSPTRGRSWRQPYFMAVTRRILFTVIPFTTCNAPSPLGGRSKNKLRFRGAISRIRFFNTRSMA